MSPFDLLDPSLVVLLLVGTVVGVLSAVLGIGGGLLMVPALTLWGATPIHAVATSLVGVVLSSISGTIQNWRTKQLNLEQVALLAPPAMLTTELGVWLAEQLPEGILLLSFAGLQVIAIYLVRLKQKLNQRKSASTAPKPNIYLKPDIYLHEAVAPSGQVNVEAGAMIATKSRTFQTQGIGLLAGVLSGLFGVGGGVVMVPLQMLFLEETIKDAVRTSLGAVALISMFAVGHHALAGNVLWIAGIYLGLGGLCGAQLGARLLPKLPDAWVNRLFRGLLLLLALYMVSKALMSWNLLG